MEDIKSAVSGIKEEKDSGPTREWRADGPSRLNLPKSSLSADMNRNGSINHIDTQENDYRITGQEIQKPYGENNGGTISGREIF